jgi:hypothetical protein
MPIGAVWLLIVVCLVMMAVCGGGGPLLGRWQRVHRRPRHGQPMVKSRLVAWADAGHKERVDG